MTKQSQQQKFRSFFDREKLFKKSEKKFKKSSLLKAFKKVLKFFLSFQNIFKIETLNQSKNRLERERDLLYSSIKLYIEQVERSETEVNKFNGNLILSVNN